MKEIKNKNIEMKDADDTVLTKRKEIVDIKDGLHHGRICKLDVYSGEFEYLKIGIIPIDVTPPKGLDMPVFTVGYPLNISIKSSLGKLLIKSNFNIFSEDNYTMNIFKKLLLGREITFDIKPETNEKGTFSNVDKETISFV